MKRTLVGLLLLVLLAAGLWAGGQSAGDDESEFDYVVGFANIAESNETLVALGDSMVREGNALGMEVIRVDNNADGARAVQNMDDLITIGVDAVVQFNVDVSVAPAIMEKAEEAGIPVFAVDIPHPGATFFGANNVTAGTIAGEFIAEIINDEWGGELDALVLVDQIASGELPRQRILAAVPVLEAEVPGFSEDELFIVEGGTDPATAQQAVADFLAGNPDMSRIAILSLQDDAFRGVVAAVEVAGREGDVIGVTNNEAFFLEHAIANPEEDFFRGAVTFYLPEYGRFLMPTVREVLDGAAAPENVYVGHEIVTRANMDELFPNLR